MRTTGVFHVRPSSFHRPKPPAIDTKIKRTVVLNLPPILVKPVRAVAVSPDKLTVAAGRGNQIHLFDAKTGDFKKTFIDPDLKTGDGKPANSAHISLVESMAYSPDGKTLATGSFQEVTLWDTEKGTPRTRIAGFADRVVAIHYAFDGKLVATGGEEGIIRLYSGVDGKLIKAMLPPDAEPKKEEPKKDAPKK